MLSVEDPAVSTVHPASVLREVTVYRDQTPPFLRPRSYHLLAAPPPILLCPPVRTLAC